MGDDELIDEWEQDQEEQLGPIVADWEDDGDDSDDEHEQTDDHGGNNNNDDDDDDVADKEDSAAAKELNSLKRKDKFEKLKQIKKQKREENEMAVSDRKTPDEMLDVVRSSWPPTKSGEAGQDEAESAASKLTVDNFFSAATSTEAAAATTKQGCSFVNAIGTLKKKLQQTGSGGGDTDEERGSPLVLVICASAQRAVEVINSLSQGLKCKIAKLFAKHFKVEEQVEVLSKQTFPCAVGTPNRLAKLIELGALSLSRTQVILIDEFLDEKKLNVMTMPMVRDDFYALLEKSVMPEIHHIKMCLVQGSLRTAAHKSPATDKKKQQNKGKGRSRFHKAKFSGTKNRKGF